MCGTALDFTTHYAAGKTWAEAYYSTLNTGSDAFVLLNNKLNAPTDLATFLWSGKYNEIAVPLLRDLAAAFHCRSADKCTRMELFRSQWVNCSVTLNAPASFKLGAAEKVCGVGMWERGDAEPINYEFGAYLSESNSARQMRFTPAQLTTLFSYDMGGMLGYYSLFNLSSAVYAQTPLDDGFPFTTKDGQIVLGYLTQGLLRYVYGGVMVSTTPVHYLWNQTNSYTQKLDTMTPLEGGATWRSNAASLRTALLINNYYLQSSAATTSSFRPPPSTTRPS